MGLNLQYEEIGKGFVTQYYHLFDDTARRPNLVNLYNAELSCMTFEGQQTQGAAKILEKLQSLAFQNIRRVLTAVDSQPMFDGGVVISVMGRLQVASTDPGVPSHLVIQTLLNKGQWSATITIRNQPHRHHHSMMNYHSNYQVKEGSVV